MLSHIAEFLNPYSLNSYSLGPAQYFYFIKGQASGNFDSRNLLKMKSREDLILKGRLQPRQPCMDPRGPTCISPGSYGQIQEAALPNNPPHPTNIPFDLGPPLFQQMSSREDFMCRLLKKPEEKQYRIYWSG